MYLLVEYLTKKTSIISFSEYICRKLLKMDTPYEIEVTPSKLREMIGESASTIVFGDDLLISRGLGYSNIKQLKYPFKINSYFAAYCFDGEIECTVNLTKYKLTKGMLLLVLPGNIVRITDSSPSELAYSSRFTFINVASSFLSNVGLDISKLLLEALTVLKEPCIMLCKEETLLLEKYVNLITDIINADTRYSRESISSLISSVFYLFAGFMYKSKLKDEQKQPIRSNRHKAMFEQFLQLVGENHTNERLVGFYADKLCVTPKYLSRIIKGVSGKTAPEWIDEFVILTAKHLLKHSSLSIKEIAIKLNFQSQSFFFRFFKRITGMTPTQYRIE